MNKEVQQWKETSLQLKRRRMLKFHNEALDPPLCNEEISPVLLKSKDREDSLEEALSDMTQWVSGFAEDTPGLIGQDQSSEGWLADCFNDSEMHCSSIDVTLSGESDVQIDISGRKSYMRTPTKMASSVAYPFAFVKPCGYYGDLTLKEINQRIHNPSSSKPKLNSEGPCVSYPTSAFSRKPVVGKTKIHTEGGKGSITIMTTKG